MKLFSYSSCSTCRRAINWLKSNKIAFELIDILNNPPSKKMLISAAELYGDRKNLINTSGVVYRSIGSEIVRKMSDNELFDKLFTKFLISASVISLNIGEPEFLNKGVTIAIASSKVSACKAIPTTIQV